MIQVTRTFLPPQEEYNKILKLAWDKEWLTNRGELVLELEALLKQYLDVKNVIAMTNGTLPIQIAIKMLEVKGEILTTPFSYVATISSIVWEGCTPVFVDIHPEYLTIDETKIEAAITNKTTAILATHVFGNPCHVEEIDRIAKKYKLKVIYDAAHCFGVDYKGQSIFNYGDASTCSFHATKIFHTGEGGAIFCNSIEFHKSSFYSHNFGHNGPSTFYGVGINGKMSELQAAMGLTILPHMNYIIEERRKVVEFYKENLDFTLIRSIRIRENTIWNYSYFPIVFKNEEILERVIYGLQKNNIYPRRYFYPSLNNLPYVASVKMKVSDAISASVICLPLYVGLTRMELSLITDLINKLAN